MRLTTITPFVVLLLVSSCMHPPKPAAPRPVMPVTASFGRTWDAVVAIFNEREIPFTTDRRSGSIASGPRGVPANDSSWVDCGTAGANARVMQPETVVYKVVVQGDSTASTVHATALFGSTAGLMISQCSSRGTWETQFEGEVRSRAEQH